MQLLDRAERLMQTSPSMLIFVCSLSAFTLGYSYTVFAQIADVEAKDRSINERMERFERRLQQLEAGTEIGFLQIEISANERELYQLELANQRNECPSICVNRMLDIRRGLQISINRLNNLNNMRDSQ